MTNPNKISYYDLRSEISANRIPALIGRNAQISRLARIANSKLHNNAFVVGPSGIGKTTFVYGWFAKIYKLREFQKLKFIQLHSESFFALANNPNLFSRFEEALENISDSIIFIDNFGSIVQNKTLFASVKRLLVPLLGKSDVRLILNITTTEMESLNQFDPSWVSLFEVFTLKNQPVAEQVEILRFWADKLAQNITIKNSELELIVKYAERFASLGQLPSSSIKILDESISAAKVEKSSSLTAHQISKVVADKTGVPLSQLSTNEIENLKQLEPALNKLIIGQRQAIAKISSVVARAKLGLKNPNRPLASFLILGPSGVGKTETAKMLAETVFGLPTGQAGKKESFIRIDMSEFAQEHTVARLIGAPAGYVGYDEGGVLTNAVKAEPYSLILLDEIEKAHSKVFDIFLQILDDGRLTSGRGETVNFTNTIIMATSNLAVNEILNSFAAKQNINSNQYIQSTIIPVLSKAFRLEFINRFDSIIVFNPLSVPDLIQIAALEISKIEQRITTHKIKFKFDEKILRKKIETIVDQRFGARPVKRFIEELCENILTKQLLNK